MVYQNPTYNSCNKALIISRTRKANGKNNAWCNTTQDKHISVDFSKIKDKILEKY